MALPSSGGIMMTQVASELGVSAAGLTLGAANVRALAGISSGAIMMSNLRGKASAAYSAVMTVGRASSGDSQGYTYPQAQISYGALSVPKVNGQNIMNWYYSAQYGHLIYVEGDLRPWLTANATWASVNGVKFNIVSVNYDSKFLWTYITLANTTYATYPVGAKVDVALGK